MTAQVLHQMLLLISNYLFEKFWFINFLSNVSERPSFKTAKYNKRKGKKLGNHNFKPKTIFTGQSVKEKILVYSN